MRDFNLYNIALSDLELFLNAAKYGSFTKAGEKMFMTQSWASKKISQLESTLDLTLFIRSQQKLLLTPAGRVLEERLLGITDNILDAIQAAYVAQTGASGSLRLGYLEWTNLDFLEDVKAFIEKYPQCNVEIYRQNFSDLRDAVAIGRMDVIFNASYDCAQFTTDSYNMKNLYNMSLMAYMHKDHPLAGKTSLSIEDLRTQPMLMVDQMSSTGYGNYIRDLFIKYNIRPIVSQFAHDGGEHIGNILINKGILLASEYFLDKTFEEQIARVPIENEELYVTAVWQKQNLNPVLKKFIDFLLDTGKNK